MTNAVAKISAEEQDLLELARLRFIVGFLGEADQGNWWTSRFFSSSSGAFLTPVFAKTSVLAQYHGVKEVARRAHDEHIGVGRVFHLFRLPESVEQALFESVSRIQRHDQLLATLATRESAMSELGNNNSSTVQLQEGPIQVTQLEFGKARKWLRQVAGCYYAAFSAGARSYPYYSGSE